MILRIISQNKQFDVSYEAITIYRVKEREKYCFRFSYHSGFFPDDILAEYSTESKADKAMKMLHDRFSDVDQWNSEYVHEINDYPKVFEFPNDDEIEV